MNRTYDYNGVLVSASRPKTLTRTVKKTIHIDSGDRDTFKYYTNGDFWVYLPRIYQNVVSIRLKDAQFPPLVAPPSIATTATTAAPSNPSAGLVTYTVTSTTGMSVGNTIVIAGATTAGYNGTFMIQSIPTGATFVVRNATTGTGSFSSGTATIYSQGAATHSFGLSGSKGENIPSATYTADTIVTAPAPYFLLSLEGLNKVDETTVNANRSTYSDSFFAKIPATATNYGGSTFINYNDHSALENIATFSPPIGNLDRMHITARLQSQQDKSGFLYWTTDGAVAAAGGAGTNVGTAADFNLTFEIEYLDNGFSDFSSIETRLAEMR
jgi:hypothetical protein